MIVFMTVLVIILIIIIWWPTPLCRIAQWNKPLDFFVLIIVLVCHYDYYDCFGLQLWFGDALTQNGEPTWRVVSRGGRHKTWIPQTDQILSPEFHLFSKSSICQFWIQQQAHLTFVGSPPRDAILSWTHCNAATYVPKFKVVMSCSVVIFIAATNLSNWIWQWSRKVKENGPDPASPCFQALPPCRGWGELIWVNTRGCSWFGKVSNTANLDHIQWKWVIGRGVNK